jgi:hypothetical protein
LDQAATASVVADIDHRSMRNSSRLRIGTLTATKYVAARGPHPHQSSVISPKSVMTLNAMIDLSNRSSRPVMPAKALKIASDPGGYSDG